MSPPLCLALRLVSNPVLTASLVSKLLSSFRFGPVKSLDLSYCQHHHSLPLCLYTLPSEILWQSLASHSKLPVQSIQTSNPFPLSVDILPTNDWGNKRFSSGNSLSHFPPRCPHPSLRSSLRSWRSGIPPAPWLWPVTHGCCSIASLPPPLEPLALNWSRVHQCLDFQYTKVFASLKNFNSTQLYLLSSPHIIK